MNILIIDDHPLTCQGLAGLLTATQPDCHVRSVHSAEQAMHALTRAAAWPEPDWLFLDIHLPDDPNFSFFHHICQTDWIDRTILISGEPENQLIGTALAAGARGFIPKTADPNLVTQGFTRILAGDFYLPPDLARQMQSASTNLASVKSLSPRLLQVQNQLLQGASNKIIARELNLSAHTVKQYVSSVLAYHGVASRLTLVLKFSR
jgi:two-component system, NarL family, nitrate/nitrite response regulator NarL